MSSSTPARSVTPARTRAMVTTALVAGLLASVVASPAHAVPAATSAPATVASTTTQSWAAGTDRDFDGDEYPDVLAVAGNGDLLLYPSTPTGTLTYGGRIGTGWAGFTHVFAAGDFSGDGEPDVMARDRYGNLFLYRGDGAGGWLGGGRIGTGWQGFTAILSPGDFNGDGATDVIARDGSGRLFLYPGDGAGGWLQASQIGTGWANFKFLVGAGDMNYDGATDLVAVTYGLKGLFGKYMCAGATDLYEYRGTGLGGFASGSSAIGSGWCSFDAVISGGDRLFIARDSAGNLWRYERHVHLAGGAHTWSSALRVGTGWSGLRLVG